MQTTTFEELAQKVQNFATERDWDQFHNPKNLVLALSGETGELCEVFQWLTPEESMNLTTKQLEQACHEIADVQIYLMRLAQKLNIDILSEVEKKLVINGKKYPANKAKGRADKYTSYETGFEELK